MRLFEQKINKIPSILLSDRFLVPPFSVFDTKQGYWQSRKHNWIDLGIQSELGRKEKLTFNIDRTEEKFAKSAVDDKKAQQTSIFDPVLCEIAYKWFSLEGAKILDPFAGGSVRGMIAGMLGRHYTGIDLSEEQIAANFEQYDEISSKYTGIVKPLWINGNSENIKDLVSESEYDMIFSCPPYYNLEVYSQKSEDLSNKKSYYEFLESYDKIIRGACELLKENSFAVFVVSNIRGADGMYYDLVGDTIRSFQKNGVGYYNEGIIVNVAGTLPIRVAGQFNGSRKLGKQHQNFLVFYKGDTAFINDKFGSYETTNI